MINIKKLSQSLKINHLERLIQEKTSFNESKKAPVKIVMDKINKIFY
jgi:hypothetical protein